MSNIVYTVIIGDTYIPNIDTSKKAEKLAIKACKENPECPVYVSWFRSSDEQHGYLNRGGHHGINGQDWQK